jgi:hypothetical protein
MLAQLATGLAEELAAAQPEPEPSPAPDPNFMLLSSRRVSLGSDIDEGMLGDGGSSSDGSEQD